MKKYITLTAFVIAVFLSSCSLFPDSKTEDKLNGTWRCTFTYIDDESTVIVKEDLNLNIITEKFEVVINFSVVLPVPMYIGEVSYSGDWFASTEKLVQTIEEESVVWHFSDLLPVSDRIALKSYFENLMQEQYGLEGGRIIDITPSSFSLKDEQTNEPLTFHRIGQLDSKSNFDSGDDPVDEEEDVVTTLSNNKQNSNLLDIQNGQNNLKGNMIHTDGRKFPFTLSFYFDKSTGEFSDILYTNIGSTTKVHLTGMITDDGKIRMEGRDGGKDFIIIFSGSKPYHGDAWWGDFHQEVEIY